MSDLLQSEVSALSVAFILDHRAGEIIQAVLNNPIQADLKTSTSSETDTISRSSHVLSPVLPTMAAPYEPDGEGIYDHVVPDIVSSKSLKQRFFGASSGLRLVKDTYELKMGLTKGPNFPAALSRRPEFWDIQPVYNFSRLVYVHHGFKTLLIVGKSFKRATNPQI